MITDGKTRHGRISPLTRAGGWATTSAGSFQTVLPFDYAATFKLTGLPGNLLQDVINFNADGTFVATAIGYGLEGKNKPLQIFAPPPSPQPIPLAPGSLTLQQIPGGSLIRGFGINPRFVTLVFDIDPLQEDFDATTLQFSANVVDGQTMNKVFEEINTGNDVSFMFSMVDTDSGRELQDQPTHNLASLGISNGERPFRMLARPMYFVPRSTLRMQIEERSEGVEGTLFIVLYGYKVLSVGCPEPAARTGHGPAFCRTETIGNPSDRIIPFDYVTKFHLTGQAGNVVEDEIAINVEGGFVATAMGYGLAAQDKTVAIKDALLKKSPNLALVDLTSLQLNIFPPDAWIDGIRVRPEFVRFVFDNSGSLNNALPIDLADQVFERLNAASTVSFRYSILDSGSGRELQNQPLHNLAGLGIANGRRPFKQFVRPMISLPRTTLRVTVEERFGRGELYIVFQGYKILGTTPSRGGM